MARDRRVPYFVQVSLGNFFEYCILMSFSLSYRRESKTVEVCGTNIRKTFTGNDSYGCVEKLKNIYEILNKKKVPNVDNLLHADNEKGVVYLGPKGTSTKPKNQKELIEAICCVLEALVVRIIVIAQYMFVQYF